MNSDDHDQGEKTSGRRISDMPWYFPGSERFTADSEAFYRSIIDGDLKNVAPINGSLVSLMRTLERVELHKRGKLEDG